MFRRRADAAQTESTSSTARISSVLADGTNLSGRISGAGGVRIEGAFEGAIELDGLLVIGPTGRVTCPEMRATSVIVAGAMRGNIRAERVEIRSSGRVWGDVVTASMSTQEGAFLRGQIQMEDEDSFSGESTEPSKNVAETEKKKVPPKKRRAAKKKKNKT